ncbi:hypothetical protein M2103_002594 [Ereboglobus sp. PH5-5]|uniref:hypothetical protein n=1 Tax=Ereboglobus sp. PH5-5 TaxID=2940529 RepID=UPI002404A5F0|nr:hypothetical protein [Ereboglobus sp. PH5-5]MDF9834348.1 hypothetical protein [Ereboglobus sp. PH5-5]
MGFFDRFTSRKNNSGETTPAPTPAAAPAGEEPPAPAPSSPESVLQGTIKTRLLAAHEKLQARDLPGAMAVYEELLQTAGDRADVLVTISADLGTAGYIPQIIELVAPRYDAERHGPATGINLLQAYLATNNTAAAQHVLDILFALNRADLEERLHGFSNALAELIEAEKRGELPAPAHSPDGNPANARKSINLVSISRPIWAYGIEELPGVLPSPKQNPKLRHIAFAQLSILGIKTEDALEKSKQPEDELARFTRGFPLWLSETFYYSPHYNPIAALALFDKDYYAIFPVEWTKSNIEQLVASSNGKLDYVITGAVEKKDDTTEILLRVWEVKKMRERKQFHTKWTSATADVELAKLHEQIRLFMEWQQEPGAPACTMPARPEAWCQTLGASLSFFLADKNAIPAGQVSMPAETLALAAKHAADSERETFAYLTLADRAQRIGMSDALPAAAPALAATPLVEQAKQALGLQ